MTKPKQVLRAALYARFSSDVQKDRSIDRQYADLEKIAPRIDLKLNKKHYFEDRAQSATSLYERPGLTRDLMTAAKARQFDVVLVEATDRLSRDRADLFWLVRQLKFYDVTIYTPSGPVTDLQLTFDGHQNADFVEKLARRVKSGHDEVARDGKIPHGAAYGYDCVPNQPGVKAINKDEAKVVVRIFKEYISGKSPRQIAADLMKDKVPSPTGSPFWNYQSIVGGSGQKRGFMQNHLYVGVYLKNRYRNVKNPETGKTITREADADDLIRVEVPHLRIVDQKLWDAAHKLRQERGNTRFGSGMVRRAVVPRKPHLLSGLLRCGECNGGMIVCMTDRTGKKRVTCSTAHNRQTCKHAKSYNLGSLTSLAVDNMLRELTNPEFLAERAKAKATERARLQRESSVERLTVQKQYDRLAVQIAKLVRVLEDEDDMPKEVLASLRSKEVERKGLQERLRLLGAENNVVTLTPHVITAFGTGIRKLQALLKKSPDDPECRMAFANIIDGVIVHPTGFDQPYEISLYARLSAIMGVDLFPVARSAEEVVAAEGLSRVPTQAGVRHHAGLNHNGGNIILLGRWRAAA